MEKHTNKLDVFVTVPRLSEWRAVKVLRLRALKNEPQAFKSSFAEESVFTNHQWKEKIKNSCDLHSHEFFCIAKYRGKSVGLIGAEKQGDVWVLKAVYVDPKYRGKGIGRELLETVLWKLEYERGAECVELIVNTMQKAAIALYQLCGFRIVGIYENSSSGDGGTYTKYNMRRTLHRIAQAIPAHGYAVLVAER